MMYRILISEDNEKLHQPFKELAYQEGVDLTTFKVWEEAQAELDTKFDYYQAVILDGKGQINKESKEADMRHITVSVDWLTQQHAIGRSIPVVIFTGFLDEIESFRSTNSLIKRIVKKGENLNSSFKDVLSFLKPLIDNNPEQRIRSIYPEVFKCFGQGYLNSDLERRTLKLLLNVNDPGFEDYFNEIRKIIEAILLRANEIDNQFFPDTLIIRNDNRPNLTWAEFYFTRMDKNDSSRPMLIRGNGGNVLSQPDLMKGYIRSQFQFLLDLTQPGSHYNQHYYTKNSLRAAIFALTELICWFKYTVDTRFS